MIPKCLFFLDVIEKRRKLRVIRKLADGLKSWIQNESGLSSSIFFLASWCSRIGCCTSRIIPLPCVPPPTHLAATPRCAPPPPHNVATYQNQYHPTRLENMRQHWLSVCMYKLNTFMCFSDRSELTCCSLLQMAVASDLCSVCLSVYFLCFCNSDPIRIMET